MIISSKWCCQKSGVKWKPLTAHLFVAKTHILCTDKAIVWIGLNIFALTEKFLSIDLVLFTAIWMILLHDRKRERDYKIQWTHYSLWIRIFLLYFYIFCSEGEFQNLKCEAKRMGATFLPVISHIIVVLTVLDYFCYRLLFTRYTSIVFTKAV